MKNKHVFTLLLFLFIGLCACSNPSEETSPSIQDNNESYAVAENVSFREGTDYNGDIVLASSDFIGFKYEYDQAMQEYIFTFNLTVAGQRKMTEATTELAESAGELSLWIGNELIVTPRVVTPITGSVFAIHMADLKQDGITSLVEKLEGKEH